MKILCDPGFQADRPPSSPSPFWFYGENVRFRLGLPETFGLFSRVLVDDEPLQVDVTSGAVDLYEDDQIILIGSGERVTAIVGSTITPLDIPLAGSTGRWWFAAAETFILAGRTNLTGTTYVIDRDTLSLTPLPNAPAGGMGGGIVNGIFLKAGTDGVAGDGPHLVVRWSARRTDPSSSGGPGGPFGFEDWTPSDLNASGEFLLDEGSQVIGAVATQFGFVVWTDTYTYLLQPRADSYVFTLTKVAQRGLLSPKSYVVSDGRLWWFDTSRTLNVYDAGGVRQIPNPMRHASTDRMRLGDAAALCAMMASTDYGEVILVYPDADVGTRELVFNYLENAWYVFNVGRLAVTDQQAERPSLGVDSVGDVFFYGLPERLAFDLTEPPQVSDGDGDGSPPVAAPPPGPPPPPLTYSNSPEPFSFFLMTNHISSSNLAMETLKSRNVTVAMTVATVGEVDPPDEISLTIRSWGRMDLREAGIVTTRANQLGDMLFPMRAGGKNMQICLSGEGVRSLVRFGEIDMEAERGGEK